MFVRLRATARPVCAAAAAFACASFFITNAVADDGAPHVFALSPDILAQNKAKVQKGDPALKPAFDHLIGEADKDLKTKPESVMDKILVPPSGDKHDYQSLAPYFWPDPKTKTGLPYIRHDGKHNPEADADANTDARRWNRTTSAINTLALAYYFSGKEVYAARAALLIRTWFLDPKTAMKPHLKYAQAVRGVNDGRGTGLIETAGMTGVCDSVGLLEGSPSWTSADNAGLQQWTRDYLAWMQTSKNGKDEAKAANNHGTWYDVQIVDFALFTGQNALAKTLAEGAKEKRLASQIEPDGSLPKELARTNSLSYSIFDLTAFEKLATLAQRAGVDLWHYQGQGGRGSIEKAVLYLAPYADPKKPWTGQQITPPKREQIVPLLWQAAAEYKESAMHLRAEAAKNSFKNDDRAWLLR